MQIRQQNPAYFLPVLINILTIHLQDPSTSSGRTGKVIFQESKCWIDMVKEMLWMLPFACFGGGYYIAQTMIHITQFEAPSVEGKSLYEAATEISNHQLTLSILRIKKDSDLPHGTIIRQTPAAGQIVKPRQTMFVTISEQPPLENAPNMVGKAISTIESELRAQGKTYKLYPIASQYPKDTCIAQYPAADQPIAHGPLTLYIAQPHNKPFIVPNFIEMPLQEAMDLLHRYAIETTLISSKRKNSSEPTHIINQRPLAGSLIYLNSPTSQKIQLHVQ